MVIERENNKGVISHALTKMKEICPQLRNNTISSKIKMLVNPLYSSFFLIIFFMHHYIFFSPYN